MHAHRHKGRARSKRLRVGSSVAHAHPAARAAPQVRPSRQASVICATRCQTSPWPLHWSAEIGPARTSHSYSNRSAPSRLLPVPVAHALRHCSCNGVYAGQHPIAWMAHMFSARAYAASAVPLTLLMGQHNSCSPSYTRAQTAALAYLRVRKRREHPVTELHAALRQPDLDLGRILGRLRVRLSRGD